MQNPINFDMNSPAILLRHKLKALIWSAVWQAKNPIDALLKFIEWVASEEFGIVLRLKYLDA